MFKYRLWPYKKWPVISSDLVYSFLHEHHVLKSVYQAFFFFFSLKLMLGNFLFHLGSTSFPEKFFFFISSLFKLKSLSLLKSSLQMRSTQLYVITFKMIFLRVYIIFVCMSLFLNRLHSPGLESSGHSFLCLLPDESEVTGHCPSSSPNETMCTWKCRPLSQVGGLPH